MSDINTILNACELVWRQQSVANNSITDMRSELESHLVDAQSNGKSPEAVVGSDVDHFARSWAGSGSARVLPATMSEAQAQRVEDAERTRTRLYIALALMAAVTVLGFLGPKSDFDGLQGWQWVFVIATFTLLIGELMSGGFFILPFGIGAAATTLLTFAKVEPPILILVFIVVSALGLWGLREFASKDDDTIPAVGATRYVDQTAVVTEAINGIGTVGRVRFETESWMAITDGNRFIPADAVVRITEVRGARLVVKGA